MRLLVSACEVSGDRIAARLADPLREVFASSRLAGSVGERMREAGVAQLARAEDFSHVGWASVASSLPRLAWKVWRYFRAVARFQPQAALLVDAPGLHGPLIRRLRRGGVPLVWVAPPQLWAWKDRRWEGAGIRVHPLHEFELPSLLAQGFDARWLGYPGGDRPPPSSERDLLALLPGSRRHWRDAHRSLFLEALSHLDLPLKPVFVHPDPPASRELGIECLSPEIALPRAALALALPGTGALELARLEVPTLLAARPGRWDAWLARRRLEGGFKGLPNRILGEEVFPERFSSTLEARELATALEEVWVARAETRGRLASLEDRLRARGAERRIAGSLAEIVRGG